jgi:hypothetical protein
MDDRPKAKTELVVSERIDDELVVYDGASHTAHCLSSDVASVWELCDGRASQHELAQRLALDPPTVERAVNALSESGLLDEAPAATKREYSRREAAARLAKAGGAAFAAPLIYSVAVPSMAAAISPNPACGSQPPGCTGLGTGPMAVGTSVNCGNLGVGCGNPQACGNFIHGACCYGICAWTGAGTCDGAGATYICSTQYRCIRRGSACPSSTTATCGTGGNSLCCSPNGKAVSCSTTTGANFGCCSGQCSGGLCI